MSERTRSRAPIRLLVRLHFYLWLFVPAVLGGGMGITLAHRADGPPVREATPPTVVVHPAAASRARARVYRDSPARTELASWSPGLHPLGAEVADPTTGGTA